MEAEESEKVVVERSKVHQGRNVRRARENKGIGQTELADLVHLSQPTVSRYEMMRKIDKDILLRFANALKVPVEYLETLEEDTQTIIFENNNNVTNSDYAISSIGNHNEAGESNFKSAPIINPIDKISELYERLLKEEKDKVAALEKRIGELERKYEGK